MGRKIKMIVPAVIFCSCMVCYFFILKKDGGVEIESDTDTVTVYHQETKSNGKEQHTEKTSGDVLPEKTREKVSLIEKSGGLMKSGNYTVEPRKTAPSENTKRSVVDSKNTSVPEENDNHETGTIPPTFSEDDMNNLRFMVKTHAEERRMKHLKLLGEQKAQRSLYAQNKQRITTDTRNKVKEMHFNEREQGTKNKLAALQKTMKDKRSFSNKSNVQNAIPPSLSSNIGIGKMK